MVATLHDDLSGVGAQTPRPLSPSYRDGSDMVHGYHSTPFIRRQVFLAAVLLVQYVFRLGYLSGQTPRSLRPVLQRDNQG